MMSFEEEVKRRFKQVYVPNWFSVDLKTGVGTFIFILLNNTLHTLNNTMLE